MSKRTWAFGAVVALLTGVGGCSEPDVLVPAAPPGVDIRPSLVKKDDSSEAVGEQAAKTKVPPGTKLVVDAPPSEPTKPGEFKMTPSGVKYETLKEGTGDVVRPGQLLEVHYTGTLEDGRKFDSSRDRGKTFGFVVGAGGVIRGWDEAIPGMKIGERRKLTVPPSAAYGAQGHPPEIPPNATLIFDIEVISAK